MFGLKKKNNSNNPSPTDEYKKLTDNLYQQNIEIASKNRSLSTLRKLYELSILTLNPRELAKEVSETIQQELSFEFVSILQFDAKKKLFRPLGSSSSTRLEAVETTLPFTVGSMAVSLVDNDLIADAVKIKTSLNTSDLSRLWGNQVDQDGYLKLQEEGHIRLLVISPLQIDNKVMGLVVFGINREYSQLTDHEIESLNNFNNIIAVAVDRAVLYQKLTETNDELGEANEKLKVLDKQKTEFVSLASHQLRGPLTAINGYVELLVGGDYGEISENISDPLKKVQTAVKDLAVLVGDYLDVTRIELGRMKYDLSDFSISDVAKEVSYELSPVIEKNRLVLIEDIEEGLMVNADRNKIKQVMLNLIDNAVKYSEKGNVVVSVRKVDNKKVRFSVNDAGTGISEDVIKTLFQKFTRAPGAQQVNATGTGLGLFVAKKILDEHKGKIWVESEGLGKGSTFSFELDLK